MPSKKEIIKAIKLIFFEEKMILFEEGNSRKDDNFTLRFKRLLYACLLK